MRQTLKILPSFWPLRFIGQTYPQISTYHRKRSILLASINEVGIFSVVFPHSLPLQRECLTFYVHPMDAQMFNNFQPVSQLFTVIQQTDRQTTDMYSKLRKLMHIQPQQSFTHFNRMLPQYCHQPAEPHQECFGGILPRVHMHLCTPVTFSVHLHQKRRKCC